MLLNHANNNTTRHQSSWITVAFLQILLCCRFRGLAIYPFFWRINLINGLLQLTLTTF